MILTTLYLAGAKNTDKNINAFEKIACFLEGAQGQHPIYALR
jgi:hypothetical protein